MSDQVVLVVQTWKVSKKENSAALVRKALAASGGLGPPAIDFHAKDWPEGQGIAASRRAIKKFPELAPMAVQSGAPGAEEPVRGLRTTATSAREPMSPELLLAVLDGVPRSFAFPQVDVVMRWPAPEQAELRISDAWWVNGRMRSMVLSWRTMVEDASSAAPVPGQGLSELLAALGKPKSTACEAIGPGSVPAVAISDVMRRHRASLAGRLAALDFPHHLEAGVVGRATGPKKPALIAAFGPLGFDCRGEHGVFVLRRRTAANHVVELWLDVGTWSHSFSGFLSVHVPGGRATMPLMPGPGLTRMTIDGADGWKRIVENLAVLVADLETSFVADVETAAGPAPEWFEPLT